MARIQSLPSHLINQIAAGEVVERPASVVKELLENSLDAGARAITVELERGGLRLMRVRDDGIGMSAEELPLALARHATSKIASLQDLERVASLGFRGEALPSIASVARLQVTSRTPDDDHAWCVAVDGEGRAQEARPAAHPPGTTIEVRDLFHNVPARRKFLKSERTEFGHIEQVVRRLALSRFDTAFRLIHNDREVFNLPPANEQRAREQRLVGLCGRAFVDNALHMDHEAAGLRLHGWLAEPAFSRSQADLQHFFVNGRMVRDKLVSHAVRQAYEDVLHNRRFPAFVLYLELDPMLVDVNAHPAKHEVRFRESRLVHDFLFSTLHHVLESERPEAGHNHNVSLESAVSTPPGSPPSPGARPPGVGGYAGFGGSGGGQRAFASPQRPLSMAEAAAPYRQLYSAPATEGESEAPVEQAAPAGDGPPLGYALGQLHGIYIVAQNDQGLVLVDMHAAHERVLYERMKARFFDDGQVASQPLLVEQWLEVTPQEADAAEIHGEALARLGLELNRTGPTTLCLRATPTLLPARGMEAAVRDVLTDLAARDMDHADGSRLQAVLLEALGNMACKSAIQAHRTLTLPEMNALLRDVETTDRSGQCNHGRPSWLQLDLDGLDRLFMRGQ